jgi:hypothetical protein
MTRKEDVVLEYEAPQLCVVVLQQTDVIRTSVDFEAGEKYPDNWDFYE